MKVLRTLLTVMISVAAFTACLNSQPRIIFQIYGGVILPMPDLGTGAEFVADSTYYLEKNYGMKFGINLINAELKYAFDKKRHLRGVTGVSASVFMNPKDILTLGFTKTLRETFTIVSLYLGGEFAFLPEQKLNPFAGLAFTSNFISGDDFSAESRYGIQLNCGADFSISNKFGMVGGIKLDFANLFGKSTDVNKFDLNLINIPLSDGEFVYHGKSMPAKGISYFQFYLGFSYFIDRDKKIVND